MGDVSFNRFWKVLLSIKNSSNLIVFNLDYTSSELSHNLPLSLHESAISILLLCTIDNVLVRNIVCHIQNYTTCNQSISRWFVFIHQYRLPTSADFYFNLTANSSHYFYVILKIITLFSIVSLLYTSEVFFENIFLIRPWKALFVTTDDSIQEWWFRWKIDRYVRINLL